MAAKIGISNKDEDLEEENEESGLTWKKFTEMYEESIQPVKDEKTFFVHGKKLRYAKDSLGVFNNKQKLRWTLVWITASDPFEKFIVSLILLNSLFLGIKDYKDKQNLSLRNRLVEFAEPFFTWIFFVECISKIIA